MGRCCFEKVVTLLLCFGLSGVVYARCPLADKYHQENKVIPADD